MISIEIFLSYVKVNEKGCFIWQRCRNRNGYGVQRIPRKNRNVLAHRISFSLFRGEIPDGLFVCHKCDVRECVNPAHLFLGTIDENQKDAARKGRMLKGSMQPNSRLNESQIPEIRKMIRDGKSLSLIGMKFGVSPSAIRKIKLGRTWSHVG